MRAPSLWTLGSLLVLIAAPLACGGEDDSGLGAGGTAGQDAGTGGSGGSSATGGSGGSGGSGTGGSSNGGTSGGSGSAGASGGAGDAGAGGSAGASGTAGAAGSGGAGGVAGKGGGGGVGGAGGVAGKGGSGGAGGAGGKSCSDLQYDYAAALLQAKACNPILSVLQCTQQVDDQLACPCPTFVNPQNTAAMKALQDIKAQWIAQKCNIGVICPAVLCPQPSGAVCTAASSTSGTCKDTLSTQ